MEDASQQRDASREPERIGILADGRFIAACVAVLPALGAAWSSSLAWVPARVAARTGSPRFFPAELAAVGLPVALALLLASALALMHAVALADRRARATGGAGLATCIAALAAAGAARALIWALEAEAVGSVNGALDHVPDFAPMAFVMPGIVGLAIAVVAVLALVLSALGTTRRPATAVEAIAWLAVGVVLAGVAAGFGLREMSEQLGAHPAVVIDGRTLIAAATWWLACGLLLRQALPRRRDVALVSLVAAAIIIGLNDRVGWLYESLVGFPSQHEDLGFPLIAITFVAVRFAFWACAWAVLLRPVSLQRTLMKAAVATAASFIVDIVLLVLWSWLHMMAEESLRSWSVTP